MRNLNSDIEEASVGTMLPIVTPDETLSKASPTDIDTAFASLKLYPDIEDEDEFDEGAVDDVKAKIQMFNQRKAVRREMTDSAAYKKCMKEFSEIIPKIEKYLKENDPKFVQWSKFKHKVIAVTGDELKEICDNMGVDPKNAKLSIIHEMYNGEEMAKYAVVQDTSAKDGTQFQLSSTPVKVNMKYWRYYREYTSLKYFHVPASIDYFKKVLAKVEKGDKNIKMESVDDILLDNGIQSVLYEALQECENTDVVVFESFKKKSGFVIENFKYSADDYKSAINDFFDDLTSRLDPEAKKDIKCTNGHIIIKDDTDYPIADDILNALGTTPALNKHQIYRYQTTYVFTYNGITFSYDIDIDTYESKINLLYVDNGSEYYALSELLTFIKNNKKVMGVFGNLHCYANCIITDKHVNIKNVFSHEIQVLRSKGKTTIRFVPEQFSESFDYFTESAQIDDDIKDTIKTLNEKGYETKYSCSGHPSARLKSDGKRDGIKDKKLYSTAKIVFAKDYDFMSIPEGWEEKKLDDGNVGIYVKGPTFKIINGLPIEQFYKWKQKYMNHLRQWADDLPDEKDSGKKGNEDIGESVNEIFEDLMIDLA